MAHNLDTKNGEARFAFGSHTDPWHRLGVPIPPEETTLDRMMEAAHADFTVKLTQVVATDENGQPLYSGFDGEGNPQWVYVDNSRATLRVDTDGAMTGLATVGTRYHVSQNRDVMERALAVVAASEGDARIDTVGVLDGGRRFFATVLLDGLVLDLPDGVTDEIGRYLGVTTSHDGKVPITFANNNVRWVCANTVAMGLRSARSTFKARHTVTGMDNIVAEARKALKIAADWSDAFKAEAEKMAHVPAPGTALLDKVIADLFPLDDDATDRQKSNHDDLVASIRGLYRNDRNAAKYGENGWTVFNAVGEYLDHYRPGTDTDRALTSMNPDSWVTKTTLRAQALILA